MAFYYCFNQVMNSMAGMDQSQAYFPNFSTVFTQNEDFYNPSFYSMGWHQPETLCHNQVLVTAATTVPAEEGPSQSVVPSPLAHTKRRAQKTIEKQIISAKKNSESNLINQFYSFFSSRQKSEKIVERCCLLSKKKVEDVEKILTLFYTAVRYINVKRGRKYVNSAMLLKFFVPDQFSTYLPEFKDKIEDCGFLTLGELCQIFRRCTVYFLKNISVSAILTSKRISIVSKEEHLRKRRKVLRSVLEN